MFFLIITFFRRLNKNGCLIKDKNEYLLLLNMLEIWFVTNLIFLCVLAVFPYVTQKCEINFSKIDFRIHFTSLILFWFSFQRCSSLTMISLFSLLSLIIWMIKFSSSLSPRGQQKPLKTLVQTFSNIFSIQFWCLTCTRQFFLFYLWLYRLNRT